MACNEQLRRLGWWAYTHNGEVAAATDYMRTMHTLDGVVVCKSHKKPKSFDKNREKLMEVMDGIGYRSLIRDALLRDINDGVAFYYFDSAPPAQPSRFFDDQRLAGMTELSSAGGWSVLPLPADWCRIVGRRGDSYVLAFDLRYFDNLDDDTRASRLSAYPREMREAYPVYRRGGKPWLTLNWERTIVTKIRSAKSQPWGVPLAVGAIDDILYAHHFTHTRRALLDRVNNTILYETFPEKKDGLCSLTQSQQKEQHETIKNALNRPKAQAGLSFFSLAAGTKLDALKVDTSLFDDRTERAAREAVPASMGVSPAILSGSANSNYATSTLNAEFLAANVYSWICDFVAELNKCANRCVIRDSLCVTELHILPTTHVNKNTAFEQMRSLYLDCGGSLDAVIAAAGFDAQAYSGLMEHEASDATRIRRKPTVSSRDISKPSDSPSYIAAKTSGSGMAPHQSNARR